ncbi:MAG: glycosyltransferase family 39 protein [Candidatus Omnitrophica bacterium]|nr:glycosyltransferase family 39 protein [Candidatus Omnitrophota bacterium]MDD5671719.1 glycosyltransferase family 39 protein [Candidatus Omnitrophota bacterium]
MRTQPTLSRQWLLWAILVLGFTLRMLGIQFGLPHLYHADEPIIVNHALAYGSGDFNPHFFKIPPLVSYLVFICYGIYFLIGSLCRYFPDIQAFEYAFYADPAPFYLMARVLFGAVLGTLTIVALYRIVLQHFSKSKAILSAFFLAVCFLHVSDSHYVYADIPLVFVMVIAMGVFFKLMENGNRPRLHVMAGALIGLAVATKYNGIVLAAPYLFASLAAVHSGGASTRKGKPQAAVSLQQLIFLWLIAGVACGLTYAVLNPYSVLDFRFFLQELRQESRAHAGGTGWVHHFKNSLAGAMGVPLLLASCLGMLRVLWKRNRKAICAVVFVVSYYAVLCLWGQVHARYVLPLVPFMLFLAADLLAEVSEQLPAPRRALWIWALLVVFALPTLLKSLLFDRVMMAGDTRTQAQAWVETHIPAGAKIALDVPFFMPRLDFSQTQLEEKKREALSDPYFSNAKLRRLVFLLQRASSSVKPSYHLFFLKKEGEPADFLFAKPAAPYRVELLKAMGIEFVIAVRLREDYQTGFYDALRREGELLTTFSPYRGGTPKWPFLASITGGPFMFQDLWRRERNGQPIEIYRLK